MTPSIPEPLAKKFKQWKDRRLHEVIRLERQECLRIAVSVWRKYEAWGSEIAVTVAREIADQIRARSDNA